MGLFKQKPRTITTEYDMASGVFGKVGSYYLLPARPLLLSSQLTLTQVPCGCMFNIFEALVNDKLVGYAFSSAFSVVNGGSWLITSMKREPSTYTVMLRTNDVIVYSFPNAGALAVSPKVSTAMHSILMEQ